MRILQATLREDPSGESGSSLVVAYVYFEAERITIQPVHSALEGTLAIRWLRTLIEQIGGSDPYADLVSLRLQPWAFEAPQVH